MRRFALLALAVLFAALVSACSDPPRTTYSVEVSSSGAPVNWTSAVDNGARDAGVVHPTSTTPVRINLALAAGERATVDVSIPPTASGYAGCTSYLGAQALSQTVLQDIQLPGITGSKPPVECVIQAQ